MSKPDFSLATVLFGAELHLLELQARSIARFCRELPIRDILLIVNETAPGGTVERLREMVTAYGDLAPRVRILTGDDLFTWDNTDRHPLHRLRGLLARHPALRLRRGAGWAGNDGWQMQQAMKLASARAATGDVVVILDAKNIFLRPVRPRDLVAPDGRARSRARFRETPHRPEWRRAARKVVGAAEPVAGGGTYLPVATPFVIGRPLLQNVLDHVERRVGPVQTLFTRRFNKAAEFMIIEAYCQHRLGGVEQAFVDGLMRSYTVFKNMAPDLAEKILAEAETENARCLGLHRGALTDFAETHWEILTRLLIGSGLFSDSGAILSWRRQIGAAPA